MAPSCLKILLISPTTGHSAMLCSHPHLRRPCPGAASAPSLLCLYLKQHCMAILVLSIRDSALHDFRWFLQLTQYIQYMCLIVYIYIYIQYVYRSVSGDIRLLRLRTHAKNIQSQGMYCTTLYKDIQSIQKATPIAAFHFRVGTDVLQTFSVNLCKHFKHVTTSIINACKILYK